MCVCVTAICWFFKVGCSVTVVCMFLKCVGAVELGTGLFFVCVILMGW